ncbi:hypothetical protein ACE6H2_017760 [Prunus campanulata]
MTDPFGCLCNLKVAQRCVDVPCGVRRLLSGGALHVGAFILLVLFDVRSCLHPRFFPISWRNTA